MEGKDALPVSRLVPAAPDTVEDLTPQLAEGLGLDTGERGVVVSNVEPVVQQPRQGCAKVI